MEDAEPIKKCPICRSPTSWSDSKGKWRRYLVTCSRCGDLEIEARLIEDGLFADDGDLGTLGGVIRTRVSDWLSQQSELVELLLPEDLIRLVQHSMGD